MGEAHIRDVLSVKKSEYKEGKVSTRTLCGLDDPEMNTLTFATPESVYKRKCKYPCEKCRNIWVNEIESDKEQKRQINKFRKLVHETQNMQRFTKRR